MIKCFVNRIFWWENELAFMAPNGPTHIQVIAKLDPLEIEENSRDELALRNWQCVRI